MASKKILSVQDSPRPRVHHATGPGPEPGAELQITREALIEAFVAEAGQVLPSMEQGLLALEVAPGDAETLHGLFRAARALKDFVMLLDLDRVVSAGERTAAAGQTETAPGAPAEPGVAARGEGRRAEADRR